MNRVDNNVFEKILLFLGPICNYTLKSVNKKFLDRVTKVEKFYAHVLENKHVHKTPKNLFADHFIEKIIMCFKMVPIIRIKNNHLNAILLADQHIRYVIINHRFNLATRYKDIVKVTHVNKKLWKNALKDKKIGTDTLASLNATLYDCIDLLCFTLERCTTCIKKQPESPDNYRILVDKFMTTLVKSVKYIYEEPVYFRSMKRIRVMIYRVFPKGSSKTLRTTLLKCITQTVYNIYSFETLTRQKLRELSYIVDLFSGRYTRKLGAKICHHICLCVDAPLNTIQPTLNQRPLLLIELLNIFKFFSKHVANVHVGHVIEKSLHMCEQLPLFMKKVEKEKEIKDAVKEIIQKFPIKARSFKDIYVKEIIQDDNQEKRKEWFDYVYNCREQEKRCSELEHVTSRKKQRVNYIIS